MSIFNDGSQSKEESKRTIIAVVLSTVIVGVGFIAQNALFPPAAPQAQPQATTQQVVTTQGGQTPPPAATVLSEKPVESAKPAVAAAPASASALPVPVAETTYIIETDLLKAVLSNSGGDIVSLQLKDHKDKTSYVDLIVPGEKGASGISLAFGAQDALPVKELMNATWLDGDRKTIQFSRTFYAAATGTGELLPFTYKKAFTFRDGEYLFGMAVTLEGANGARIPLNSNGTAYTHASYTHLTPPTKA